MSLKNSFRKILMLKPSMYSESLILNVLGMQIYRILFFYLRRVLRVPKSTPPELKSQLKDLKNNGVLAIPNFFSAEDYAIIRREYDRLSSKFRVDPSEILLPHVNRMSLKDKQVSEHVRDLFLNNKLINTVALSFLNRKYNLPLDAAFTKIYCTQEELDLPKNGGTNNLHFDTPTRLLKCFYYLSDTTEDNAAFYYCIGTNKRNSLKRLWFEYKLSVRYALNRWNHDTKGEYRGGEPWVKITKEEMLKYGLTETIMEVKGNTMLFADISGFHRRGEFKKPGVREGVEINYRSIETLRNDLYPLEQKIKSLLK